MDLEPMSVGRFWSKHVSFRPSGTVSILVLMLRLTRSVSHIKSRIMSCACTIGWIQDYMWKWNIGVNRNLCRRGDFGRIVLVSPRRHRLLFQYQCKALAKRVLHIKSRIMSCLYHRMDSRLYVEMKHRVWTGTYVGGVGFGRSVLIFCPPAQFLFLILMWSLSLREYFTLSLE